MKFPRSNNRMVNIAVWWMMLPNHSLVIGAASNTNEVSSIAQHLKKEHDRGNVYPKFTIGIHDTELVQVMEAQPLALLPTTLFSIYGRESRFMGELGTTLLVGNDDDYYFALLAVNKETEQVTGVVGIPNGDGGVVVGTKNENIIPLVILDAAAAPANDGKQESSLRKRSRSIVVQQNEKNQQVINLYLEIDYQFIKLSGGGTLCNAFEYINALVTAANAVLKNYSHGRNSAPRVNVVYVNQTTIYDGDNDDNDYFDSYSDTGEEEKENHIEMNSEMDALHKMKSVYGNTDNWHYEGIHLHYAFLGRQFTSDDSTTISSITSTNTNAVICNPQEGFGILSGMKGSFENLDGQFIQDVQRFVDAIR